MDLIDPFLVYRIWAETIIKENSSTRTHTTHSDSENKNLQTDISKTYKYQKATRRKQHGSCCCTFYRSCNSELCFRPPSTSFDEGSLREVQFYAVVPCGADMLQHRNGWLWLLRWCECCVLQWWWALLSGRRNLRSKRRCLQEAPFKEDHDPDKGYLCHKQQHQLFL